MAVIELVTESYTPSAPKKKATRRPPRRRPRPSRSRSRPTRRTCRGRGDRRGRRDPGRRDRGRRRRDRRGAAEAVQDEAPARTRRVRGRRQGLSRTEPRRGPVTTSLVAGPRCVCSGCTRRMRPVGEVGVHERYDARALAGRGGDPLHRAGADVAGGEDAGDGGRQVGRGQAVDPELLGDVAAGEHEAVLVAADLLGQPVAPGRGAEQQEQPARLVPGRPRRCSGRGPRSTPGGRRHHRRRPRRTHGSRSAGRTASRGSGSPTSSRTRRVGVRAG